MNWRTILRDLTSDEEAVRRRTIQMLVDSGESPITAIECWPEQRCTDLQLASAEFLLLPLDRERFAAAMYAKFDDALEHIIETVAASETNLDLAKTEAEVGQFLHELRWDALNLALEMRVEGIEETPSRRSVAPSA